MRETRSCMTSCLRSISLKFPASPQRDNRGWKLSLSLDSGTVAPRPTGTLGTRSSYPVFATEVKGAMRGDRANRGSGGSRDFLRFRDIRAARDSRGGAACSAAGSAAGSAAHHGLITSCRLSCLRPSSCAYMAQIPLYVVARPEIRGMRRHSIKASHRIPNILSASVSIP